MSSLVPEASPEGISQYRQNEEQRHHLLRALTRDELNEALSALAIPFDFFCLPSRDPFHPPFTPV